MLPPDCFICMDLVLLILSIFILETSSMSITLLHGVGYAIGTRRLFKCSGKKKTHFCKKFFSNILTYLLALYIGYQ